MWWQSGCGAGLHGGRRRLVDMVDDHLGVLRGRLRYRATGELLLVRLLVIELRLLVWLLVHQRDALVDPRIVLLLVRQEVLPDVVLGLRLIVDKVGCLALLQDPMQLLRGERHVLLLAKLHIVGEQRVDLLNELFVPLDQALVLPYFLFQFHLQSVVILLLRVNGVLERGHFLDKSHVILLLGIELLLERHELQPERTDVFVGLLAAVAVIGGTSSASCGLSRRVASSVRRVRACVHLMQGSAWRVCVAAMSANGSNERVQLVALSY